MSGSIGDNVYRASGVVAAAAAGGGAVSWQTGAIKVTGDSPVTGVAGEGYFLNTTAGAITVNLPAGAAGSIVSMADYARTWDTNNVTVEPNGSEVIGGGPAGDPATLTTAGQSVTFVYIDGTQGWLNVQDSTSNVTSHTYMIATGGSPCTGLICGDCKVHSFTGPGTLCVSQVSSCAPSNVVSYLVIAGGGSGGSNGGNSSGGGGAGGFREYKSSVTPYTASPLNGNPGGTAITVTATGYPIVVGGGGASVGCSPADGNNGNPSTFSTITSTAGGYGGSGVASGNAGGPGGSGGGGGGGSAPGRAGGTGNTPSTTPSQGFTGGTGGAVSPDNAAGGGGGATELGVSAVACTPGRGGEGVTTQISGSLSAYAGGAGAAAGPGFAGAPGSPCGTGGAGSCGGTPGTINTGGGGGGAGASNPKVSGLGGSGVVVIRDKYK